MKTTLRLSEPSRGFAALISAILLSAILTVLVFVESTSAFWVRYDQTDAESTALSTALADSCIYEALLQYEENPLSFGYPETISIGSKSMHSCTIDAISVKGERLSISAHATIARGYVQMTGTAEMSSKGTLSLLFWR